MLRTLLVEDNAVVRSLVKEVLEHRLPSLEILQAADATEALQIMEDFPPDLVLMDIRLPDENGLRLTRRIKKHRPHTTVIILTSYDYPEYREAAAREGAFGYVTKGELTVDRLMSLIQCAFPDSDSI